MLTPKPPPFATFPAFGDAGFNDFNPQTGDGRDVSAFAPSDLSDFNDFNAVYRFPLV